MTLVFNASPIIVLAKARLLDRLIALGDPSVVPHAVAEEVSRVENSNDPARVWLQNPPTSVQLVPSPPVAPFLAAWDLGDGESAVISSANGIPDAVAVLDDLAARRCAQAHGIKVMGTIGLILMAKRRKLIQTVAPALEAVENAGLFIAPRHLAEIRSKAGEA